MNSNYRLEFMSEADTILGELETALLELGSEPNNMDAVSRVFLATRSLNKAGSMFGFDAVAAYAGVIESVFEQVRNGNIPISWELTDLTLLAGDRMRSMIRNSSDADIADNAVIARFRTMLAMPVGCGKENARLLNVAS